MKKVVVVAIGLGMIASSGSAQQQRSGPRMPPEVRMTVDSTFAMIDTNKDGVISKTEFAVAHQKVIARMHERRDNRMERRKERMENRQQR